jgi:anti-sigma factor RsiW
MNKCTDSEIQELLPDLLHGSLDDRARREVEAHLASCESCREDLDVIRTVKSAAIFAPVIDADRVARQIPPYGIIVPAREQPARTKMVQWLVAAGLLIAVVGGGSLVMSKQTRTSTGAAVAVGNGASGTQSSYIVTDTPPIVPVSTPDEAAPGHSHALALGSNVDDLSDGNLVQLMNDMDQFDALPAAEPEPVISVDSGDSL